jgi:hypothetical protein
LLADGGSGARRRGASIGGIVNTTGDLAERKGDMPRQRPSSLRRSQPPRALWRDEPHVRGLGRRDQHAVSLIELPTAHDWARHGLWPGAVGEALAGWRRIARHGIPRRRRTHVYLPCDCCGRHPRQLLEEALDLLDTPAADALAALIGGPDDEFWQRTVPDPHLPADLPWWRRRFDPRGD